MITTLHTLSLASSLLSVTTPYRRKPPPRVRLVARRERGRRCPPRCCAARWSCTSPLARPSSQRAARPSPATRRRRSQEKKEINHPTPRGKSTAPRVRLWHPTSCLRSAARCSPASVSIMVGDAPSGHEHPLIDLAAATYRACRDPEPARPRPSVHPCCAGPSVTMSLLAAADPSDDDAPSRPTTFLNEAEHPPCC